ncbi:hypothetical protein J4423_04025 [Candidatus Pacearchaeota archaeon]|nr:hypothetical protein [Candidatus Pacearchaeota archaeon]
MNCSETDVKDNLVISSWKARYSYYGSVSVHDSEREIYQLNLAPEDVSDDARPRTYEDCLKKDLKYCDSEGGHI